MHSGDEDEAAPSDVSGILYATREPRLRAKFEKIFVYCIEKLSYIIVQCTSTQYSTVLGL